KHSQRIAVGRTEILQARDTIDAGVYISEAIKTALVDISRALRADERILQGNSTRSLVLILPALQVLAAMRGRNYVNAVDLETLLPHVLAHRVEMAPGSSDFVKILRDNMRASIEQLARSTLNPGI